jgi:hypothetical protein
MTKLKKFFKHLWIGLITGPSAAVSSDSSTAKHVSTCDDTDHRVMDVCDRYPGSLYHEANSATMDD